LFSLFISFCFFLSFLLQGAFARSVCSGGFVADSGGFARAALVQARSRAARQVFSSLVLERKKETRKKISLKKKSSVRARSCLCRAGRRRSTRKTCATLPRSFSPKLASSKKLSSFVCLFLVLVFCLFVVFLLPCSALSAFFSSFFSFLSSVFFSFLFSFLLFLSSLFFPFSFLLVSSRFFSLFPSLLSLIFSFLFFFSLFFSFSIFFHQTPSADLCARLVIRANQIQECVDCDRRLDVLAPSLKAEFRRKCLTVFPHCVDLGGSVCAQLLLADTSLASQIEEA
jgi:hypothetical protein